MISGFPIATLYLFLTEREKYEARFPLTSRLLISSGNQAGATPLVSCAGLSDNQPMLSPSLLLL
jgi:hypothetical protein